MVDRTIKKSSLTGGKYASVHLRFEEDMVAFSCYTYDGGWKEKIEMGNARERSWKGKFRRPGRVINPEANRRDGKCPLTPLEVRIYFSLFVSVYMSTVKSVESRLVLTF